MREILKKSQKFLEGMIFEIVFDGKKCDVMKYVHFKIKSLDTLANQKKRLDKVLLQIIDVSDRMLYNEAKAE